MSPDPRLRVVLDLFEAHYETVFRFARRSVDDSAADDIAQEVFTRLLRLPDLCEREIRGAYLIKIAENLIRRRFNQDRRASRHAADVWMSREASVDEAEVPAVAGGIGRDEAARAVEALSDREREAVDLVVCRGLSYRAAAASMGVKVSDVNNWRYRGVEKLRREAAPERPGSGGASGPGSVGGYGLGRGRYEKAE